MGVLIDTARLRALLDRRYTDEATASDHDEIYAALPGLLDEVDRLRAVIERDRTRVIDGVNGLTKEIESRAWLQDGCGPYEWNDDNYRLEFRDAAKAIQKALMPLKKIGSDLSDCPTTQEGVMAARAALNPKEATDAK